MNFNQIQMVAEMFCKKLPPKRIKNLMCVSTAFVLIILATDIYKIKNNLFFNQSADNYILNGIIYICFTIMLISGSYLLIKEKKDKEKNENIVKIIEEPTIYVGRYPADIRTEEIEIKENIEEYMEANNEEDN